MSFMNNHSIFDTFQSGFQFPALIKVTNDLLLTADPGDCLILIFLDLSSAFDKSSILLSCLEKWVGIRDTALDWFNLSVVVSDASSPWSL